MTTLEQDVMQFSDLLHELFDGDVPAPQQLQQALIDVYTSCEDPNQRAVIRKIWELEQTFVEKSSEQK